MQISKVCRVSINFGDFFVIFGIPLGVNLLIY